MVRNRKDDMSVRYVKHVSFNFFGPSDGITPAACGAETVFAIMVYFGSVSALGTGIDIYAKSCSAARTYCLYCFILFWLNKVFWVFAVIIPPEVKKGSKAIFFFTKPVMFNFCMNSTFTHVARVFVRTASTTHGSDPKANTKIRLKSELVFKKELFSGLNFARENQIIDFLYTFSTDNWFTRIPTFGADWFRGEDKFSGYV